MRRWLKHAFYGPQVWLTIGAVLIASSLVVRYHQDQLLADAALAEMIDLPEPVAIQDFVQEKHTNMLEEFQLLAEVDLSAAGVRTIGEGDTQEIYLFVPAYPLSDSGRDRASLHLHGAEAAEVAIDRLTAQPDQSPQSFPIAILVYDVSTNAPAPLGFDNIGLRSLGAGIDGEAVLLAGTMFDRAMWIDAFTGATFDAALDEFLGEGASFLPLVAPYRQGNLASGAASDLSLLGFKYFVLAVAFFICGGVMMLARVLPEPRRTNRKAKTAKVRATSIPPFSFFQPIASQEDLIDADQDASPSVHVPKFVTRAADAVARGAGNRVKSRL